MVNNDTISGKEHGKKPGRKEEVKQANKKMQSKLVKDVDDNK